MGRQLRWPVVDKDDVNDILYGHTGNEKPGPLAYEVMFNVARRQLLLGLSVICDSPLTGGSWHVSQIATETGATLAVVACRCSDEALWRERINARKVLNLPAHHQTDWDTMQSHRAPDPLPLHAAEAVDHPFLLVDTVAPVDTLCGRIVAWLAERR